MRLFMVMVDDVWFPILKFCVLLVRKSIIHAQSVMGRPNLVSLLTSLRGTPVLKTQLKSIEEHAYMSVIEMACPVDWFTQ